MRPASTPPRQVRRRSTRSRPSAPSSRTSWPRSRRSGAGIELQSAPAAGGSGRQQGKARYQSRAGRATRRKVAEYDTAVSELTAMEGWSEYNERIRAPGLGRSERGGRHGLTTSTTRIRATVRSRRPSRTCPNAFRKMKQEITAYLDAANEQIRSSQGRQEGQGRGARGCQRAASDRAGVAHQRRLPAADPAHRGQRAAEPQHRIAKTTAEQQRSPRRRTTAARSRPTCAVRSRPARSRTVSSRRSVTSSSRATTSTARSSRRTRSCGRPRSTWARDKAYVGQKFVVSVLDRNGNRVNTGEIMIVRVTGEHAATGARSCRGSAGAATVIHNPFYEAGEHDLRVLRRQARQVAQGDGDASVSPS